VPSFDSASPSTPSRHLYERIVLPTLDAEEDVREETPDVGRAEKAIDYLDQFDYAPRKRVILLLLLSGSDISFHKKQPSGLLVETFFGFVSSHPFALFQFYDSLRIGIAEPVLSECARFSLVRGVG
jgi:hypothetical protein